MVNKKINVEANEIDFDVKSKPPRAASACAYAIELETLVKKCWIKDIKDIFYLVKKIIQWNLVIVNSVLSPILFTNERFLLLQDSMFFSFITYN